MKENIFYPLEDWKIQLSYSFPKRLTEKEINRIENNVNLLLKDFIAFLSYDMEFKSEKCRKEAVKMYFKHFNL